MTNDNSTTSTNGAIYLHSQASLVVSDSTFEKNSTLNNGAAINAAATAGNITINDSTFEGNEAKKVGGALYANGSSTTVKISSSTFKNNTSALNGGALGVSNGTVNISGSTFSGNSSTAGSSGAVHVLLANVTISTSLFSGNSSAFSGGAIGNAATLNVYRSVFSGNVAGTEGGAIASIRSVSVENSVFYNNRATNEGGALHGNEFAAHTVIISHATFVNNQATGTNKNGNSVYFDDGVTANMRNSIIKETKNSDGTSYGGTDCSGLDANNNNIIQDGSCDTVDSLSADPQLASLADSHHTLLATSPAINAAPDDAHCPDTDIRGSTRPYGNACDIGAWEWYPPPPSETPPETPSETTLQTLSLLPDPDGADATTSSGPAAPSNGHLLNDGLRLWAQYGLQSGIQFQRHEAGAVGVPSLIDGGVLDVVDVWGYADQDWVVCFPQGGSPVFLDAAMTPRELKPAAVYSEDGFTCIANDRPGMVVLQPGPPPPQSSAQRSSPQDQGLQNCLVRTNYILNFRETPGGEIITLVPYDITLTALERTADWFKVDYRGTQGWISAGHVTPQGGLRLGRATPSPLPPPPQKSLSFSHRKRGAHETGDRADAVAIVVVVVAAAGHKHRRRPATTTRIPQLRGAMPRVRGRQRRPLHDNAPAGTGGHGRLRGGGSEWLRAQEELRLSDRDAYPPLDTMEQFYQFLDRETGLRDLTPLARLPNLKRLYLNSTFVNDLAPLAELHNLEALDLSFSDVSDLAPLASLVNLTTLNLRGTAVTDLAAAGQDS